MISFLYANFSCTYDLGEEEWLLFPECGENKGKVEICDYDVRCQSVSLDRWIDK